MIKRRILDSAVEASSVVAVLLVLLAGRDWLFVVGSAVRTSKNEAKNEGPARFPTLSPAMPAVQDVSAAHAFDIVVSDVGDSIVAPIPRKQVFVGPFGEIFRSKAVEAPAQTQNPLRIGLQSHWNKPIGQMSSTTH